MTVSEGKYFGRKQGKSFQRLSRFQNLLFDPTNTFFQSIIDKTLVLEIGIGDGMKISKDASKDLDKTFIGCDIFIDGVLRAARYQSEHKLKNLFVFHSDIQSLVIHLPMNSLDTVRVFFPDPWPKKRHSKRRFLQLEIIKMLHKKIKNGGKLLISSDDKNYIAWTLSLIFIGKYFSWLAESPSDWRLPSNNYSGSKYEKKGLKSDREPYFLKFLKI